MKRSATLFVIIIIITMTSCGPGKIFGPTLTPTPTRTFTPTGTSTQTPTLTASLTTTPTSTNLSPLFYPGIPETPEQFTHVEISDLPEIIKYLHSQPSLLDPGAPPIFIHDQVMTDKYGRKRFVVICSYYNDAFYDVINCAPAASVQIADSYEDVTLDPHLVIWEVMTSEGRRYLTFYTFDSLQDTWAYEIPENYRYMVEYQLGFHEWDIYLYLSPDGPDMEESSYMYSLTWRSGYFEMVTHFQETGEILDEMEYLIIPKDGF